MPIDFLYYAFLAIYKLYKGNFFFKKQIPIIYIGNKVE